MDYKEEGDRRYEKLNAILPCKNSQLSYDELRIKKYVVIY